MGRIDGVQADVNAVMDMWLGDPSFLNEQRALYQTIRRAHKALSVILRVVALAVAPPPHIVNMVNEHEKSGDDLTWRG